MIGAVVVLVSLLAIISLQPKRPRATVQKLVIYPIKYTSPTHYKVCFALTPGCVFVLLLHCRSCAGTECGNVEYDARGLVGDRRYMIVTADKVRVVGYYKHTSPCTLTHMSSWECPSVQKRFISQRQKPTMALIKPEIIDDGSFASCCLP